MIKAIKLFLLKRKIGYKFIFYPKIQKDCLFCNAFCIIKYHSFCDRYKFYVSANYICNHFVPRQISGIERAELEKAKNHIQGILDGLMGMIKGETSHFI